jgi:hypothetical protein
MDLDQMKQAQQTKIFIPMGRATPPPPKKKRKEKKNTKKRVSSSNSASIFCAETAKMMTLNHMSRNLVKVKLFKFKRS